MENGGAPPHNGSSPSNFLDLGYWPSSALPLALAATAPASSSSSSPPPPPLPPPCIDSVKTHCLPFSDHAFGRAPPPPPAAQQQATCNLKLGKRQYYVPAAEGSGSAVGPAKRPVAVAVAAAPPPPPVPRCQVDGCNKALVSEKEYHKRHKVCEVHSKASKVVVLGAEQRFCQQCSRFHVISEFDDTKRSCRRRLAGHNERRRKSSNDSNFRNPSFENAASGGRVPYLSTSLGRALSLLSSKDSPWISTSELSSRSSAALRELIAENRAAFLERQLLNRGSWSDSGHSSSCPQEHQMFSHSSPRHSYGWNHFHEAGSSLTLDLMQLPSCFEFLSERSKSKEEEECCEILNSLAGAHVI